MRPVHIVGARRRAQEAMDRARDAEAGRRSVFAPPSLTHPRNRSDRVAVVGVRRDSPLRR
jgi:hypothetical protein